MATEAQALCLHRHYLNNDVHHLMIKAPTSAAVDEAIAHVDAVLDEHDPAEPLLLLLDAREGLPPIPHFLGAVRRLYGGRSELPPIRACYIYEQSFVLSVVQAALDAIPMVANRRFIKGGSEVEAIEWLLNG